MLSITIRERQTLMAISGKKPNTKEGQNETHTHRYANMDPAQFRQGDIIEVEISLALVPVKEKKYKLVAVLRSLTSLDETYSQVN
jgi:hypothetical protein